VQVMPKEDRALVRGVNQVKRHQRQSMNQEGGIITKEAPLHLSNWRSRTERRQADPGWFQGAG
jgi:ribosomal protein L24